MCRRGLIGGSSVLISDENKSMKVFVEEKIKLIEEDYIRSIDRLNSDYNREQELMKQYRGRELLELLQNADDELTEELPKEVKISFVNNILSVSNYGTPFSKEGVLSLLYPNNSGKSNRKRKVIGNKGTGFRSILGWADKIQIDSNELHIEFSEEMSQEHLRDIFNGNGIAIGTHKAPTLAFPNWKKSNETTEYTTTISIKVKDDSIISQGIKFNISDFECDFAKKHSNNYLIYYVSNVRSKDPKISILKGFVVEGEINTDRYSVETKSNYTIYANVIADSVKKTR